MKKIHNNEEILGKECFFLFYCIFHEEEQLFSVILEYIQIENEKLRLSISFSEGNRV